MTSTIPSSEKPELPTHFIMLDHAKRRDSQYTLFNPTPIDLLRPYNTDRPSKTDSPLTIDTGVFQIEGDVASWTLVLGGGRSAPSR